MMIRMMLLGAVLCALAGPLLAQTQEEAPTAELLVLGDRVYTMSGTSLENGAVLIGAGKILAVGPQSEVQAPQGVRTISAPVVTPGLIDAHSVVGMAGMLNQDHDQDQLERSAPIQPELRAIDAFNPRDPLVDWIRSFGITTIHTGHGPGAVVSGQTLIAKTSGVSVERSVVRPFAMLACTLGEGAVRREGGPGTRSKAVALLRAKLVKAQDYAEKPADKRSRDLGLEALGKLLTGEVPLLVTVERAHDITTALRLAAEFDLRLVLDGACEVMEVEEAVRSAGFPVILHPTMARAYGERENLSLETAKRLAETTIPFALQSGYESYVPKTRVVLFEAAVAAAYGLPFERALGAITIDAARLLGIDDRVGSLEVGKDADLALFDGDPFEYTNHCVGVIIDGAVVSDTPR